MINLTENLLVNKYKIKHNVFELYKQALNDIEDQLKVYDEIQKKATHIDDIHKDIEQILMQNEYTNDDMRRIIEKIVVYPDKSVEIFMK